MMLIIYTACHLFGMPSACANPFLYGWFNSNSYFFSSFPDIVSCNAAVDGCRLRPSSTSLILVYDIMSTHQGQSIKLRRISSTRSTIDTLNGLGQPLSSVEEISETIVEWKRSLLHGQFSSPEKGQRKTGSIDEFCQVHSSLEMDTKIVLRLISSPIVE